MEEYTPSPTEVLTCCEQKVLIFMSSGYQNQAIADALFVSVHTIKNHKANICQKLKIKGVQRLYIYAATNATLLQGGGASKFYYFLKAA